MTNADIQVGEYYRAKDGYIGKIDRAEGYDFYSIKSHSFNIIDLIEVDDYVNGMQVVEKYENSFAFEYEGQLFGNKQIKTIVTKEQFKAMEYEVGEEE